jgi:hypothetical protein
VTSLASGSLCAGLLLGACLLAAPAGAGSQPPAGRLQLYVMPDTQSWAWNQGATTLETWRSVAKALCRQRERFALVLHTGDLVDEHRLRPFEWSNALAVLRELDACRMPYAIAFGNHDFDNYPAPKEVRLQGDTGWRGVMEQLAHQPLAASPSRRNALHPLADGWFVLAGDLSAGKAELAWLARAIEARPNARFLFLSHACVKSTGITPGGCQKFFERQPGIRVAVSGHWLGAARDGWREVPRENGRPLVALYQNYQHVPALAAWGVVIELEPGSGALCVWGENLLSGEVGRPAASAPQLGRIAAGPAKRCFGGSAAP